MSAVSSATGSRTIKAGAVRVHRPGADSTAVRLHDGTADGQAQPGAGTLGGAERLEQSVRYRMGRCPAVVADADLDLRRRRVRIVAISTSRVPAGWMLGSASNALRTRLSTTCCSWTALPDDPRQVCWRAPSAAARHARARRRSAASCISLMSTLTSSTARSSRTIGAHHLAQAADDLAGAQAFGADLAHRLA